MVREKAYMLSIELKIFDLESYTFCEIYSYILKTVLTPQIFCFVTLNKGLP